MSKASPGTVWVLTLFLVGVGASRGWSQGERRTEIDVFRHLGLPAMAIKMTVQKGWPLEVEVKLTDEEKRPAAKRKLTLRWRDGTREIETDEAGQARFRVSKEMLPRPVLLVPKGTRASLSTPGMKMSTGTGTRAQGMDGTGRKWDLDPPGPKTLDLDPLKRLEADGVEVYYPEGKNKLAIEVLAYLARVRGFVRGRAGLELDTPYGLALHDQGILASVTVMG
ncbi:MAG: hypothetical protein ACE5JG_03625, partial [Planctomycetota bacterium]